jgi:hypothetical protein
MATTRKTGKDYQKEYRELVLKQNAFNARVRARLLELSQQHPDAIITTMGDTDVKAKSISSKSYIDTIEVVACMLCIDKIEKWLEAQQPIQQGKLFN